MMKGAQAGTRPEVLFLLSLLLLLLSPLPTSSVSPLDPDQVKALQSLGIPTLKDPCTNQGKHHKATCDAGKPYKHLLSLQLMDCPTDITASTTALNSLSTLLDLQFTNCHITAPSDFPPSLQTNLKSFACVKSLKKLMGFNLGQMVNLSTLTVSGVTVVASSGAVIFGNLKKLKSATVAGTNLTGQLPTQWNSAMLTHLDLSNNNISGRIPTTLPSYLERLVTLDLSSNRLTGGIPSTMGNLMFLETLSLSSNKLSGPIPDTTMSGLPSLVHLNLSTNQFNGTIPSFLSKMTNLKVLNLESNNFRGILPFTESFIKSLDVFKVRDNPNLCYDKKKLSPKLKLGIAACDKDGLPMSPPSKSGSSGGADDYDYDGKEDNKSGDKGDDGKGGGPNKVVLGVAIGLSSVLFLIIFLVLLAKWCA